MAAYKYDTWHSALLSTGHVLMSLTCFYIRSLFLRPLKLRQAPAGVPRPGRDIKDWSEKGKTQKMPGVGTGRERFSKKGKCRSSIREDEVQKGVVQPGEWELCLSVEASGN